MIIDGLSDMRHRLCGVSFVFHLPLILSGISLVLLFTFFARDTVHLSH